MHNFDLKLQAFERGAYNPHEQKIFSL